MQPKSSSLCVNCGISVVFKPPKHCLEHVSSQAIAVRSGTKQPNIPRLRAVPEPGRTPPDIRWTPNELPVQTIVDTITEVFGVESHSLMRKKSMEPSHRFARYLAVFAADQRMDAGFSLLVIGKKLGITSAPAQQQAIRHVTDSLKCGSENASKAHTVLARLGLAQPA